MDHKFWIRCVVVLVYIFVFEWIFHGMLLSPVYQATTHLWRPPEEMERHIAWIIAGQAGLAVMFCIIFDRGYRGGGLRSGAIWGALVGLLFAPMELIRYAVTPYPLSLILMWIAGGIVEFSLAGLILARLYRKK